MGISRGEYTAKPNLPGDESVYLFLEFTINLRILRFFFQIMHPFCMRDASILTEPIVGNSEKNCR